MVNVPSPAVAIVGRHNSGKTTLIEKLIAEMVRRGFDVGSVKHHSHAGFDIDYPGKDSYRHRAAGASDTVISGPGLMARIKNIDGEMECDDIVRSMPGHDIVIVEGYRKSGLPTIEVMRAGNSADQAVAQAFAEGARSGLSLGADFTQLSRLSVMARSENSKNAKAESSAEVGLYPPEHNYVNPDSRGIPDLTNLVEKMPSSQTVAVATDIPEAVEAASIYGIPAFDINAIDAIADFLVEHHVRPHLTVVIQAGGESKRMGQSKALVPFLGRPLICRIIERVGGVADELIITTNEPERLEFLKTMYDDLNLRLITDAYEYRGALPGLFTAFRAATNPYVAIVACDMVLASPALIVAESVTMTDTGADVVVPVNTHGFEPFHALYRKDSCLKAAKELIDQGDLRAQSLLHDTSLDINLFTRDQVQQACPMGGCFINANTPEELSRIETMLSAE